MESRALVAGHPGADKKVPLDAHSREESASARSLVTSLEASGGWSPWRFDRDLVWQGQGALWILALPLSLAMASAGLGAVAYLALGGGPWWSLNGHTALAGGLLAAFFDVVVLAFVRARLRGESSGNPFLLMRDDLGLLAAVVPLHLGVLFAHRLLLVPLAVSSLSSGLLTGFFLISGVLTRWLWLHWVSALVLDEASALAAVLRGTRLAVVHLLGLPSALTASGARARRAQVTGLATTMFGAYLAGWLTQQFLFLTTASILPLGSGGFEAGVLVPMLIFLLVGRTVSLGAMALAAPRWCYHYLALVEDPRSPRTLPPPPGIS